MGSDYKLSVMRIILIIICILFCSLSADSQTFTENLRKEQVGQGKVEVKQSAEIELLVNRVPKAKEEKKKEVGEKQAGTKASAVGNNPKSPEKATAPKADVKAETATTASGNHKTPAATTGVRKTVKTDEDSIGGQLVKKIMRNAQKVSGYRIQIYSGGNRKTDRQKCEQMAAKVKKSFPELPVYVHFYSPSWKCRVGNFPDYNEAKEMLKELKGIGFTNACIVKGTIMVQKEDVE